MLHATANVAADPFRAPYKRAWGILGSMFGLVLVMWGINLTGAIWLNILLTVIGGSGIWYFGISPIMHAYAIGIGGLWSLVSWKSPKAGISDSLHTLYSAVLVGFFVFLFSGIVLSTVYFINNPMSFWALALIAAAFVVIGKLFNVNGGKWLVGTMIFLLLLFVVSWVFNVSIAMPGNQDKNLAAMADKMKDGVSGISLSSASLDGGGCDITDVRVLATQPGIMGTQFSMKRGCPIRLDASAFQVSGQPRIGVTVRLDPNGPVNVLATGEAALYHAEPWVIDSLGRPYITIVPNDGWPEGVQAIKLIAYSNDTK